MPVLIPAFYLIIRRSVEVLANYCTSPYISMLDQFGSGAARRGSFNHIRDSSPYSRHGGTGRGSVSGESYTSGDFDYTSDYGGLETDRMSEGLVPAPPRSQHHQQPARAKVTTPATEMASRGRRASSAKNEKLFRCPVPGCTSTFTR